MSLLTWILLFCVLGGALSVVAAAVFLLLPGPVRDRLLPHGVSFAIGALHAVTTALLLGLFGFFVLEKLVLWRHCHSDHCEVHTPEEQGHVHAAAGTLILIGDGLHNFIDGILIGAAFLTDIHLGIVTSLAVAAHEIPQEVGDFAVLLHSGFSTGKAFFYNLLSSFTTVVGGLLAYYGFRGLVPVLPYVLAVAASSFIYIAVADLIPGLHRRVEFSATLKQLLLIGAGVGLIYIAHAGLHD
jgi:zinc and cadmium transporter